jgi:pimeloyl-ACP methyl ester carboxylesterase
MRALEPWLIGRSSSLTAVGYWCVITAIRLTSPSVLDGTPGSRLVFEDDVASAERHGIRLISYDRPGYGGSDPRPARSVGDCVEDVRAIAAGLGVTRCGLWGVSGGGPHALACAALLADLVPAVAVLASPAPEGCPVRPVRWCVAVTGAMRVQAGHIRECPFPDIRAKDSQHGSGPRARRAGFSARVARQKREQTPDGRVHAPPRRVGRRRGTDPTTLGRPADACIRDAASARAAPRPRSPWTNRRSSPPRSALFRSATKAATSVLAG